MNDVQGAHPDTDLDDEYLLSKGSRDANSSPRLEAYTERSRNALDLFAMLTLWIVLVPISDLQRGEVTLVALILRGLISLVFAVDMTVRARLAPHAWRYVRTHPLGLLAIAFPPIRVLFSLRLIESLFRRGNLGRFLIAAGVLLLNGAVIVYFVERDATGANIVNFGDAIWWSVVTVTTVGYGDLYPVTTYGRFVAAFLMVTGLLTLAVITANVSSSFNEQARRRREGSMVGVSPDALRELRDQIDRLLGDHSEAGAGPATSPGSGDDAPS